MSGMAQFTRYLWLVSSIVAITSLFGYLYFLETEKKEDYFNQLYLRNLGEISDGFANNLTRLWNFSVQVDRNRSAILARLEELDRAVKREQAEESDPAIDDALAELRAVAAASDPQALHDELVDAALYYYEDEELQFLDLERDLALPCDSTPKVQANAKTPEVLTDYCQLLAAADELRARLYQHRKIPLGINGGIGKFSQDAFDLSNKADNYSEELFESEAEGYQHYVAWDVLSFLLQTNAYSAGETPEQRRQYDQVIKEELAHIKLPIEDETVKQAVLELFTSTGCLVCESLPRLEAEDAFWAELARQQQRVSEFMLQVMYADMVQELSDMVYRLGDDADYYQRLVVGENGSRPTTKAQLEMELERLARDRALFLAPEGPVQNATEKHGLNPSFIANANCPQEAAGEDDARLDASDSESQAGESDEIAQIRRQASRFEACHQKLFVDVAKRRTPYPENSFAVTSYLGDDGALETPLKNFLPAELVDFSSLLVAGDDGTVIIQKNRTADETSHNFLNINHLLHQAVAHRDNNGNGETETTGSDETVLTHTAFIDYDIGGVQHRIYIYPYKTGELQLRLPGSSGDNQQLYFVGVKPLSSITADKLRIRPGTAAFLLSVAVIILLAFIFLKIQLAHVDASFTPMEGFIAGSALVFLVLIMLTGLTALGLAEELRREFQDNARNSIITLQQRFKSELEGHVNHVDALLQQNPLLVANVAAFTDHRGSTTGAPQSDCIKRVKKKGLFLTRNQPPGGDAAISYALENLFMMDANGYLTGAIVRGTEHLLSPTYPNLSERRYFSNSLAGRVWEVNIAAPLAPPQSLYCDSSGRDVDGSEKSSSSKRSNRAARQIQQKVAQAQEAAPTDQATTFRVPLVMERIFNLNDGVRSTQFAIPVSYGFAARPDLEEPRFDATERYGIKSAWYGDDSAKHQPKAPRVISFGVNLRSLQAPVLPAGLQFAVLDNTTGTVLYHSDDKRSLVENFFQETENDPNLRAHIRAASARAGSSRAAARRAGDFEAGFEPFTGLYRGNSTRFWADRLHNDIPWTLVVFDDSNDRQAVVTILFTIALLLCATIFIVVAVLVGAAALSGLKPLNWLWPQEGKYRLYPRFSLLALGLAVAFYYLLYWISDAALFFLATLLFLLVFITLFKFLFKHSATRYSEGSTQRRYLRNRYSFFVMCLLVLVAAVPAMVAINKVADEMFLRNTYYEALVYREVQALARQENSKHLQRFCGKPDGQEQPWRSCASLFGKAPEPELNLLETASPANWVVDEARLMQIREPSHTLVSMGCSTATGIFCMDKWKPDAGAGASATNPRLPPDQFDISNGYVARTLELLENLWRLPVVLDAVQNESAYAGPELIISAEERYTLKHQTPSFWTLFFGNGLMFVLLAITLLLVFSAANFLGIRLLGINIPRSYRARPIPLNRTNWQAFSEGTLEEVREVGDYEKLVEAFHKIPGHRGILIRPDSHRLPGILDTLDERLLKMDDGRRRLDALQLVESEERRSNLSVWLETARDRNGIVALENFESIAFNKTNRLLLLDIMERLANAGAAVLLVSDVAPLYMLTHQSRYIPNTMLAECADAQEIVRWSRLLSGFEKYYGWSPADLEFNDPDPWQNTVLREVSAWPELFAYKSQLDALHRDGHELSREQAIQYIATHAGPLYRRRWSLCTKEEKLLLYQLARGQLINPRNVEPLEHLLRRGFVRRDPGWSIVNESFARFVLTAESEDVYLKWMRASEQGLWNVLRVPLFTAALVILGILMYSAQEAIESFLALAAGVLAVLPALLRNFNMVRGVPGTTDTRE